MKLRHMIVVLAALLAVTAGADQAKKAQKKSVVKQADENVSGQGYGMAGCGLGSIALGDKPGFTQVFAATTNSTFGSQTFGISSGTSNCDTTGHNGAHAAAAFIYANREALEKDIARGNGETLSGLTQVLGCSDSSVIGKKLQGNFGKIFPSQDVSTDHVVDSIMGEVRIDPSLAAQCSTIS